MGKFPAKYISLLWHNGNIYEYLISLIELIFQKEYHLLNLIF